MTTKKCPHCGSEIQSDAKKCRYCKQWLTDGEQPKQTDTNNMPNPDGSEIELGEAIVEPFKVAANNIGWLFLVVLVYSCTAWIPYINIGTTIAMVNLPAEMARGKRIKVGYIFDARYRKYMGEYFSLWGNIWLAFQSALPFAEIPYLILKYGWSFAPFLLIDKEVNPSEALTLSTKYTYGYKLKMWLSKLIVEIICIVAIIVVCMILIQFKLYFLIFLFAIAAFTFFIAVNKAQSAVFYKRLVVNHE